MIDVAKVRLLEERVRAVIAHLGHVTSENGRLRSQIATLQQENDDLKHRIAAFTESQAEIEDGILNALRQLDEIEDSIGEESADLGVARVDLSDAVDETEGTDSAISEQTPSPAETSPMRNEPTAPPASDRSAEDVPRPAPPQSPTPRTASIADDDLELDIDPDETDDDDKSGPELDIF